MRFAAGLVVVVLALLPSGIARGAEPPAEPAGRQPTPDALGGELDAVGPIPWRENYLAGLDEARRRGLPLLVYFSADWCEPCRAMEASTLRDADVRKAMDGVIPVKSEYFAGSGLAHKLGVSMIPTMLMLDANGDALTIRVGYHSPQQTGDWLRSVELNYESYLRDLEDQADFASCRRAASYLVKLHNTGRAVEVLKTCRKRIPTSDIAAAQRADLDVAEAEELQGDLATASRAYAALAGSAMDRELQARALYRFAIVEQRRGHVKKATEATNRLTTAYPEFDASALRARGAVVE